METRTGIELLGLWVVGGAVLFAGAAILVTSGAQVLSTAVSASVMYARFSPFLLFLGSGSIMALRYYAIVRRYYWTGIALQTLSVGGFTAAFAQVLHVHPGFILPLSSLVAMGGSLVMFLFSL